MRFGETEVAGTSSTGTPAPASVAQPTDNNNNNNSKDLHSSALPSRPQQQSTSHLQTSRQAQAQPHSGADKDNSPTFSVPGTTPPSPSGSSRMTESMEMSVDNSADTTPSSSIQGDPVLDRVSNPSSSLRIKFKNRVHNTLASMKSSSNLRDRAKAERQAAAVGEGADTDATAPSRRFLLGDRRLSAQASLPSQDQEPKSTTATPALNATTPPTIKKKTSRTFWTFPRGKLDTSLAATSGAGSSSKQSSGWEETATKDDDITMISPDHGPGEGPSPFSSVFHRQQCQQQEQGAVDEASKKEAVSDDFDSDNSIDIIQPADYQDYTQFAEFPLKKRKKMERSLAATLAAETASQGSKRPNSMRASADAMRRFLLLQQQQQKDEVDLSQEVEGPNNSNNNKSNDKKKKNKNKKNKGKSTEAQEDTIEVLSREMGPPTGTMIIKSNKRPQLSTSTTESTDQIHKRPSTTNPGGGGASDWRRSFLRSLHLGRRNQRSKGNAIVEQDDDDDEPMTGEATSSSAKRINTTASTTTTVMGPPAVPDRDGPYPRASRSGSVRSIRSRSLLTSSHPALYATTTTTMTGSSSPRSPGMRRETLEMAIRRRRQSSAARSHINHTDIPSSMPLSSEFFGLDNNSAMNVTHTFTSFTFELADMYAHDVVNNSVTPGLFNWKYGPPAAAAAVAALVQQHRRPTQSSISRRVTVSSNVMDVDTDQEFKGFDSDGDAISGYTGDADISMEEIYVRPKTPSAPGPRPGSAMNHHRRETSEMRRRLSSIDGDSDTISELPTLLIRTRELNRSSGGSAAVASGPSTSSTSRTARPPAGFLESIDNDTGRTSPRSPTRRGANSPTLIRKTARLPSSTSSAVAKAAPLSMEEVVSWKPRNAAGVAAGPLGSSPTRPLVPALDTSRSAKSSPKRDGSGGLSSSTTLIPSASTRTPSSAASSGSQVLTASPTDDRFSLRQQHLHQHHASNSGSSQSHFRYPSAATQSSSDRHSHHPSADTLVSSSHLKNFSSASNASTLGGHGAAGSSSGVGGGHHAIATAMAAMQAEEERQRLFLVQKRGSGSSAGGGNGVQEFDPSDFPPTTPVDLKAMDFETLLATAEREHLLGWEGLKKEKKGGFSSLNRASVSPAPGPVINNNKSTSPVKEGVQSHANMQPLKIVTHHGPTGLVNPSNATTKRPFIVQHQPTQQQQQQPRVTVAFDLSPSDDGEGSGFGGTGTGTGTGTGSDRSSRSKRVMKKKMSVIRLTGGNIQGRREDDGVIRVTKTSVSPGSPPHSPPQQPQQSLSSSGFSATGRYHSQHQQQQQQRDWH
ncbi:hypothetical protein BGZ83_005289 [Gryganskiella cystojenkinii]|nr:hypothetical protein BGZ83_005289 [Gryganskiella cystojenkinii]